MQIIEDGLSQYSAQEREEYWVNNFKNKGWNILNRIKTGVGSSSLGSLAKKWTTKEKVREEALKYTSRSEFQKKRVGAYMAARKNNWLDDFEWLKPKSNYHPRHTKSKSKSFWKINKDLNNV